jgi:preprotein translocase subunit SecA
VNALAIHIAKKENMVAFYTKIKKLYDNNLVDKGYDGDLEDVELAFGMRKKRDTPRDLGLFDDLVNQFDKEVIHNLESRDSSKIRRNDPCSCGSGKKYKKCCFKLGQ